MTCNVCRYSVESTQKKDLYECRRNPPIVNPNFIAVGAFPIVDNKTWCGEYQIKKTAEIF